MAECKRPIEVLKFLSYFNEQAQIFAAVATIIKYKFLYYTAFSIYNCSIEIFYHPKRDTHESLLYFNCNFNILFTYNMFANSCNSNVFNI